MTEAKKTPHIVIIGCGFGGLEAAKALKGKHCQVTLLDRSNHHLFQPLLYQVATAGLAAPAISAPVRHIFRKQANVRVLMHEVTGVDANAKQLTCADGSEIGYDALIIAAGAGHSYFGNDAWGEHAPGLKTLADALAIRQNLLTAFERAEVQAAAQSVGNANHPAKPLRFVVIGAGPTGVEMAGTMAEIARHTLKGEFRHIDPAQAEVVLVEGGPRVLPTFSDKLSAKALVQLQRLGVTVRLNTQVTQIEAGRVQAGGNAIAADCIVWAAGVRASHLGSQLGVALDRAGRVPVNANLSVAGLRDVYVVGDMASAQSKGKPVPGVSPAAKQMGRVAARNALAALNGAAQQTFTYKDYGSLATIGRKAAIAQLGKLEFWGVGAWVFWLFVHVYFLIGFRNRALVLLEWAWSYLSFSRSARSFAAPMADTKAR